MQKEPSPSIELFYCYAREDQSLREQLSKHLASLKHSGMITEWYDGEIIPGVTWQKEIDTYFKSADIILLLISPDFIHSDHCYSNEMKQAIQRHWENTAHVIPILLRPVDWTDTPFSQIQMLPTNAKPVTSWSNTDEAYRDIALGIRRTVINLRNKLIAEGTPPSTSFLKEKQGQPPLNEIWEFDEPRIRQRRIFSSRRSPLYYLDDDTNIPVRPIETRSYKNSYSTPLRDTSTQSTLFKMRDESIRRNLTPSQKTSKQPLPIYATRPTAITRRSSSTFHEAFDNFFIMILLLCLTIIVAIIAGIYEAINNQWNSLFTWMGIGALSGITTFFIIGRKAYTIFDSISFGVIGAISGGFILSFFQPQLSWIASLVCACIFTIAMYSTQNVKDTPNKISKRNRSF